MIAALLLALMAQALTPAAGGHVSTGDPRSTVVMPEQRIDLRFDHRVHVEQAGIGCTDCHAAAKDSKDAKDFLVPARTACIECHDEAEIPQDWSARGGRKSALSMPPAHLHFPHAAHVEIEGVRCSTCHEGVAEAGLATREHLPAMETCLSCHDGVKAPGECATCHPRTGDGTIRTTWPSGVLTPDDHGPLWLKQHEVHGERDLALCASCHAQEDCLGCHDGSVPPTFHDADYLATHVQDAFANNPPCQSCHRLDTYCRDCHVRSQVTLNNPLTPSPDGAFHPPGWNDFPAMRPEHHAHVARKNLASCSACHRPEEHCIGCHAFYFGAPATHPSSTSTRMRRLRQENLSLCLTCHVLGDPSDPINAP